MQFAIDVREIEPSRPQQIKLPLDKYNCVVVDTQYKETANKQGTRLVFTLRVTSGTYSGVEVFHGINWTNPNVQSQAIGRQEVAALLWVFNKPMIQDTREIYNLPFIAQIGPGDPDSNGNTYNEVKGIFYTNGQPVTRGQVPAPTPPYLPQTPPPQPATPVGSGWVGVPPQASYAPPPSGWPATGPAPSYPPVPPNSYPAPGAYTAPAPPPPPPGYQQAPPQPQAAPSPANTPPWAVQR